MGYVYILKADKFIKFGKTSKSIKDRVKILQTGNPYNIRVIGFYKGDDYSDIERMLHNVFKDENHTAFGEWYVIDKIELHLNFLETEFDFIIDYEMFKK
jgi:hypothetical protein